MKIFVVDPALKDQRGHHYALTANIARNCSDLGHKVICLVNKSLSKQIEDDLYFVRCFSSDTYDGHAKPKAPANAKPTPKPQLAVANPAPERSRLFRIKHALVLAYRYLPESLRQVTTPMIHKLRGDRQLPSVTQNPATSNGVTTSAIKAPPVAAKRAPAPAPGVGAVAELLDSLKNHSVGPNDVVLFHTCDAHTYRDILELFTKAVRLENWNKLPQFHLSTPYDGTTMPHNKKRPPFDQSVRHMSRLGLIGKKIFLRAEHVLLADHLAEVLSVDVTALPIPPLTDLPERVASRGETTMNIMYLGAARTEKGFTTLPTAIRSTLAVDPKLNVCFHIQITPQILGYTSDVLNAVEELRQIDDERLNLIDEPLSQKNYLQLLANADVMLLNYQPDRYKFRGSGIAVESVLSATSVIAPKATFPAFIVGESGIHTEYPNGVGSAIQEIYQNLEEYRSRARIRRDSYRSEHSAKKFMQVLQVTGSEIDVEIHSPTNRYVDHTQWQRLL